MNVTETSLPGLLIIEPRIFKDSRGYFFFFFHQKKYEEKGIDKPFVQDNESKSEKGVVRGLHYQLGPHGQAKLVRVIEGTVYDVAVDLRKGSPTFGEWFGLELDAYSKKQLFIPRGFAHGFSVLSKTAIFSYKCDNVYNKESERSIQFKDPKLGIDWKIKKEEQIVSEKDENAPLFDEAEMNFIFT